MKIIERLHQYFNYKGIKPTAFEKKIGLSNGYLGTMLKRKADMGESVMIKIVENSLDLNPIWLLFGEGSMLKSDQKNDIEYGDSENKNLTRELIKEIGDLRQQLGEQINENTHLQAEIEALKKDERNKSTQRYSVYSSPDIAAEAEVKYK